MCARCRSDVGVGKVMRAVFRCRLVSAACCRLTVATRRASETASWSQSPAVPCRPATGAQQSRASAPCARQQRSVATTPRARECASWRLQRRQCAAQRLQQWRRARGPCRRRPVPREPGAPGGGCRNGRPDRSNGCSSSSGVAVCPAGTQSNQLRTQLLVVENP
eukprot:COSAG02_NODE_7119_length_3174_cov_2.783740_1_plen_164_part_00